MLICKWYHPYLTRHYGAVPLAWETSLTDSRSSRNVVLSEVPKFLLAGVLFLDGFLPNPFKSIFLQRRSIWMKRSISVGNMELAGMKRPFWKKRQSYLIPPFWFRDKYPAWKQSDFSVYTILHSDFCHSRSGSQYLKIWSFATLCSFRATH